MTRIITIRPEPGASATASAGRKLGLEVEAFPLAMIEARNWDGPDPASVDALLVASANAIRMGGEGLARYLDKPVFAVGETTASVAREAGFRVELAGDGGLQRLLAMIETRPVRLLRLAGARMIELNAPEGITVQTRIVYDAPDLPMPDALQQALRGGDALVLLHSAGAAEHFRAQCLAAGVDLSTVRIAALGPRIAEAAGEGWGELRFALKPANGVLLALAKEMCQ